MQKTIIIIFSILIILVLIQYIRYRYAVSNAKTTLPKGQCLKFSYTMFPFQGWSPCKDEFGNVTIQ